MNAEPSLIEEPSPLEKRKRIILICNELLCSGRPFAEVLNEVKRLSDQSIRDAVDLGPPVPMIGLANDRSTPVDEDFPGLREQALEPQREQGSLGFQIFGPHRALRLRRTLFVIGFLVLSVSTIAGYVQLGAATRQPTPDRKNESHLLQQLRDRGQFISKSLRPAIDNAGLGDAPQLNAAVKLRTGGAKAIRILFAPGGGESFYYAASWPNGDDFEAERRKMTRLGILDRLAASCHNGAPFELLGLEPPLDNEGVAVNPLWTPAGCWVVVSVFPVDLSGPPNAPVSSRQSGTQLVRSEAFPQP